MNSSDNREKHSADLIQTIGDIVIKSIIKHENATVQKGIDNLVRLAMEFLEMKSKNEKKFSVENESFLTKSEPKNQYMTYIANELVRIFEVSIDNKNTNICRQVIFSLSKILDKIMINEKNFPILEQLIETRGFYGSAFYRLMEISIKNDAKLEKTLLLQHLSSFPQYQIFTPRYKSIYMNEFINYHIFRMTKLIIDSGDFELFKEEINQFSMSIQLNDPGDITREIEGELYGLTYNPELKTTIEKLAFEIRSSCLKDMNSIDEFIIELENLRKEIINKEPQRDKENLNSSIDHILFQIEEYRITSRIYSVFFVIGAYLVFKDKQYDQYIRELWYHTTPIDTSVSMTNRTPVSDDVLWLTLLVTYQGVGTPFLHDTIMFSDFQDGEPFLYQYYVLLLFKIGTTLALPSEEMLRNWKMAEQDYKLDFFDDLVRDLMPDKFIHALDRIMELNFVQTTVRTEDHDERIKQIGEGLKKFAVMIKLLRSPIVQNKKILNEEIKAYEEIISDAYDNNSHCKIISKIEYDELLSNENAILLTFTLNIPREILTKKLSKPPTPSGPIASPLANLELWHILSIIHKSDIRTISETGNDYERQIRNAVKSLLEKGYKPNSIFIPLKVKSALEYGQSTLFKGFGMNMKVDDLELHTMYSWNQLKFDDIIIFDSTGLTITYNHEELDKRLQFEVDGIEEGKPLIGIECKLLMNIKVIDPKAFVKISNDDYIE